MLIAALTVISQTVKASHTMGADLTYQCLGGNTYRVTLSFYRDCIGIAAPSAPFVNVSSASCGQTIGVTCYPRPGTGQEVTPSCSSSVTTCRGGTFTGIQEWVYDGIVTLPMACADWTFSYNLCCRNAAITNISTPGSSTFYIYATLNNIIASCNNSPTFSNKPVPFLCRGQNFCFNHGAYDSEGDSITYQLITPKQTASTNVNYIAPFTASNPLTSSPTTSFNASTGDICMTPQNLEVTVMAVLVNEYRNGQLIGTVERDLQLTVMNCANNLPSLTGINGTNNFSMTVCANQPACFDIFSNDPDAGQNLTVTWDNGIPGASFTTTSASHPTATFCWTPTSADIGSSFSFTARVIDDACPYFGSQVYSYTINVVGLQANAGPDQSIACSDLATLNGSASGGTPPYSYLWSNGSTMQAVTVGEGTWILTASDAMCSATDTVVVTMPFIPSAAFIHSTTSCANTPVTFTDQSSTPGGIIWSWLWNFGDGTMSFSQNPVHQFPGPGTYNVSLIIENTLGCTDTVSQTIVIDPPPVASFGFSNACVNTTVSFIDQTSPAASSWSWNFGDGNGSTAQNPSHTYATAGSYNVSLIVTSAGGCVDTVNNNVTIFPLPVVNAGTDIQVCAGSSATLSASGGSTFTWTPGGTGTSINVTPGGTTTYVVTATDLNGCTSTDTVTVIVNPLPVVDAGANQFICFGSSATLNASGGSSYTWLPGGMTGGSVTVSPSGSTTYTVIATNADGCTSSDVVTVNVGSLPIASASPDINICEGNAATLTASGGSSYAWSPAGGTNPSITVSPSTTTTYFVTVTDGNGCSATDSVQVVVHQAPTVNLQSFFLCSGSVATLDAGVAGATYLWTPNGQTTQTINISNGGVYGVTVTDAFGCSSTGSANIATGTSLTINLGNVSFCQGGSAVLDAGYAGMTYLWSPGGQTSQTITVNAAGTYGVTVTDTSGCSGSINVTAQVNPLPNPLFTASAVCEGTPTQFTDATTTGGSSITSWLWDFGNGTTSSQQNPGHTYSTPGNYNVQLTVTDANGCSNTYTSTITVNPAPNVSFTASNSCVRTTVPFTNTTTISSGNIVSYNWDFGDGTTSNLMNPSHEFFNHGAQQVTLTVTTSGGCTDSFSDNIVMHPAPIAGMGASTVCEGNPTIFTDLSTIPTGLITGYFWDFGNGTTSTQSNPSHTYQNDGVYNATLIISSHFGCFDTTTLQVTVNPIPIASAGADQGLCQGGNINLTATGGTSYSWTPGNMNGASITVSPSSTTHYTVTVTDANGCTSTDQVAVNVFNTPTAQVSSDAMLCYGESATLTASGGNAYQWAPGGATTSSITVSPSATTHYVLTVTDANGCQDQDSVLVSVNPKPNVSAGPDRTICSGSSVALSASGAATYMWNPSGSTNSTLVVNPSASTSYLVIGTDNNGCSATDSVNIVVNSAPAVTLHPTFVCTGFTATLDAGNPGYSYAWSTGETTQTISVSDSGNYSVIVTAPNGCASIASTAVTVGGQILAFPTANEVCNGQQAMLDAGNPGSTYLWSNGSTSQSINVSSAGTYFVTITDPNGCSATIVHDVVVNPIPTAQFAVAPACLGAAVNFTNQSTITSGTIQSTVWDFGNGMLSNQNNPVHSYSAAGTYNTTLTITSNSGCTSTLSRQVTIHPNPVADFSANATCLGNPTNFTDNSSINSGSIANWSWNFGDNNQSSIATPVHIYSTAGNFNATLIVTSSFGCRDSITKNITINGLPSPAFTAPDACVSNVTTIQNNSTSNWGPINSYSWNFGDGGTSTATNPVHTYASSGIYTVTLTATTVNGCTQTAQRTMNIHALPVAAFSATNTCAEAAVAIVNNSTSSSGSIYSNYWTFGNNGISNAVTPAPVFNTPGTYSITLVTTTTNGCRDTASGNVTIHPNPTAAFATQDVCLNAAVSFTNNSTVTSGSITGWSWNFGDNTTSAASAPAHTYSAAGTYPVQLTVTSDNGCNSTMTGSVNIFPNPEPAFSAPSVCFGEPTQFINQTSVQGGIAFTSTWTFSDGSSSSQSNPSVTFTQPGQQAATLTVTSANGCSATSTQNMSIYNPPVARFSGNNVCEGITTQFTDLSTSQDGSIVSWLWDFGDGTTSTESDPMHAFSADGQYTVELTTTTQYGCTNRTSAPIQIFGEPEPVIQAMNACAGAPISFNASSTGSTAGVTYSWDLGNGTVFTDPNVSYTYAAHGTYDVTLTATNADGCIGSGLLRIEVYPIPQTVISALDVCEETPVAFNNTATIASGTIQSYAWYFGDGSTASVAEPSHLYAAPGTYQAMLAVTSDQGCTSNATIPVRVHPNPSVSFSTGIQGCSPLTATLRDQSVISSGTIVGWLWDFGDGAVSTDQHPAHVYTSSGNFDVRLTVVSANGCQGSFTAPAFIQVFPGPQADFTMTASTVDELNPTVQFTNQSQGYSSFQWQFGDGTTNTTDVHPSHTFRDTGSYSAMLITVNAYGCRDTAFRIIDVLPHSTLFAPNCFTPNGDGKNDFFKPEFTNMTNIQVWVFDRWGLLLTSWEGLEGRWDGYYEGNKCQTDTYVYKIKGWGVDGKYSEWVGHVSIVY